MLPGFRWGAAQLDNRTIWAVVITCPTTVCICCLKKYGVVAFELSAHATGASTSRLPGCCWVACQRRQNALRSAEAAHGFCFGKLLP
jgi:hypothetical protein